MCPYEPKHNKDSTNIRKSIVKELNEEELFFFNNNFNM